MFKPNDLVKILRVDTDIPNRELALELPKLVGQIGRVTSVPTNNHGATIIMYDGVGPFYDGFTWWGSLPEDLELVYESD